jgi:hypothetical protein
MNERALDSAGIVAIGTGIGVVLLPMLGPLALVAGAAIGGIIAAMLQGRRASR